MYRNAMPKQRRQGLAYCELRLDRGREGGREGVREGVSDGGREGGREGMREGGRDRPTKLHTYILLDLIEFR